MAAIRSTNTRPELLLRQALRAARLSGYRCHWAKLPGRPDIAYTRWRLAVFVDGGYWHGHPDHYTFGRLGSYWDDKVARTQARDRVQEAQLAGIGYRVLRFWDFEVRASPQSCVQAIRSELEAAGRPLPASL